MKKTRKEKYDSGKLYGGSLSERTNNNSVMGKSLYSSLNFAL